MTYHRKVPVPPHGTTARYSSNNHACRCAKCRAASAAYMRGRRAAAALAKKLAPIEPSKRVDWHEVPLVLTWHEVCDLTGASRSRIDEACANGSLPFHAADRPKAPRFFARVHVRSWHEPDLSAPRLTVDAAAKLARVAPRTITAAILRGELAVEAGTVEREAVLAWSGGAR